MTDFMHRPAAPLTPPNRVPLGLIQVGRTTYRVYDMPVGENSRTVGHILANYALEGPRGATFFITDYGPKYRLNSVACGGGTSWAPRARSLPGLTRAHFAPFRESTP